MNTTDAIVIVGGGPVGLALALALQQKAIPFKVLEARPQGAAHQDTRALALSYGTKLILERLGVWAQVEPHATAIQTIHISQRGGLGRTKLQAQEHQLPALGYVVSYGALMQALDSAIDHQRVLYQAAARAILPRDHHAEVSFEVAGKTEQLRSALLVIADGGRSLEDVPGLMRETKAYGHDALVSKVKAEMSHNNVAYERFTATGPMALLPNGASDFSLVWTGEKDMVDRLLTLDDATFLSELHAAVGDRVGQFLSIEKRMSFPLKLSSLSMTDAAHVVVIGNAAQTMHPVAGQGFNVGMRDAWTLVDLIANTSAAQLGGAPMLAEYRQRRQADTRGGLLFTDFLVNVFTNQTLGVASLRGLGLAMLQHFPPIKRVLVNKMSFGK
ncbi:FAD-dependent monooxygenase [Methylotenera sp. 1P/1]|uniref:FAD-dependent monooxygenase n=1 Tax=Methylotenera sp. 1P/1 TaxID=1131551 RepID=UPI0003601FE6|nr:FAD-dependent monooxygenase [Methylotenera sp. 1P/1]